MKNSGPIVFLTLVIFISLAMSHNGPILEGVRSNHIQRAVNNSPCKGCKRTNCTQKCRDHNCNCN